MTTGQTLNIEGRIEMISIGSKSKILFFDVSTEGIDSENLEFWFRIHSDDLSYSFKGELLENNKVKIVVLPLTEIVNEKYLDTSKVYPANVEVIGDGKYNLVTWKGEIKLEATPKINVKLENVQEESIEVVKKDIKLNKSITEENKNTAKIKVNMSEVIEEDVKEGTPKVEPNRDASTIVQSKDSQIEEDDKTELEKLEYTRTSLLEDILGTPKKKQNVFEKINNLIKE